MELANTPHCYTNEGQIASWLETQLVGLQQEREEGVRQESSGELFFCLVIWNTHNTDKRSENCCTSQFCAMQLITHTVLTLYNSLLLLKLNYYLLSD